MLNKQYIIYPPTNLYFFQKFYLCDSLHSKSFSKLHTHNRLRFIFRLGQFLIRGVLHLDIRLLNLLQLEIVSIEHSLIYSSSRRLGYGVESVAVLLVAVLISV